jgi:hypothetical protein
MPKKKAEVKQKHGRAIDKPCPKCGNLRCTNCGGKYCTACEEWKPYDEFTSDIKAYDGYYTKCRVCKNSVISKRDPVKKLATNRSYRDRHREEILAKEKLARAANPEKYREKSRILHARYTREQWKGFMLRTRYGLTLEEYQVMVERQQGRCKICGKESTTLVVDHEHDETQKVRGLLCAACNQGLGLMNDETDRILAAIAYIQFNGAYERGKHTVIFQMKEEQ